MQVFEVLCFLAQDVRLCSVRLSGSDGLILLTGVIGSLEGANTILINISV